jgi:hypothetical protein
VLVLPGAALVLGGLVVVLRGQRSAGAVAEVTAGRSSGPNPSALHDRHVE